MDAATLGLVYYISEWLIRIVMAVVIPFRRSPDAAKGWLLLVLFLPWPALILYLYIGRPSYPGWRRKRFARLAIVYPAIVKRLRHMGQETLHEVPERVSPVATLVRNLGHLPLATGNAIEFLPDYDKVVDRLVEDIDAAETEVHLLFYIFASDSTGQRVADALTRAVTRGLDVRVLLDAQGSRPWVKQSLAMLNETGAAVRLMMPVHLMPRRGIRADLRNHRKIAVIDRRSAFVGSQNLVNRDFKPGIVNQELMVRLEGPVVLQLQAVFMIDWFLETEEVLEARDFITPVEEKGKAIAQVLPSGPDLGGVGIGDLVVSLVHGAQRRIVMVTPYFVPDDALSKALRTAVLRGVEVHVVVSKVADQQLVRLAQRSYYSDLLDAGVRIHLYRDKLLHAKNLSFDATVGIVGSSNVDIRSFTLNSEISLVLYDEASVATLAEVQDGYLAASEELRPDEWRRRPYPVRVAENVARMLSPLL
jgi:cardiolipin synthase